MIKGLFFTVLTAVAVLLTGCTTSKPVAPAPVPVPVAAPVPEKLPEALPAVPPVVQPTLPGEMRELSAGILAAGGLTALGIDESKSLELALNMAKVNGRIELARVLDARFRLLEKAFSEETGIPYESLFLSGFNNAAGIIKQQIASGLAHTLKYETTGDTFTAYAVMVLDPKVIADQLAKEKELYARLQKTKAFGELNKEIKAYEAFKATQE
jgi:hypothetical protein